MVLTDSDGTKCNIVNMGRFVNQEARNVTV